MHGSVDEAGWGRHRESKNGQQRSPHLGGAQDEVRSTYCPGTGARSCDRAPWSVRSFGVVQAGFSSGLLAPPSPTRTQANSSLRQRLRRWPACNISKPGRTATLNSTTSTWMIYEICPALPVDWQTSTDSKLTSSLPSPGKSNPRRVAYQLCLGPLQTLEMISACRAPHAVV